jgi:hypothetical protein
MENEMMEIELGASLTALVNGQVKLQRLVAHQGAEIAKLTGENRELRATTERLIAQIDILTTLVDSHQRAIEILSKSGGIVQ